MKLKKIASLMLVGVMAVSMLAGCSGKTEGEEKPGDDVVVVPETGIVAEVNNGQNKDNEAKIDFTSNASLDVALTSAVKAFGEYSNNDDLTERVANLLSMDAWNKTIWGYHGMTNPNVPMKNNNSVDDDADGDVVEFVEVFTITSEQAKSENAAMKKAAETIDKVVGRLHATSYVKGETKGGDKYCDYTYTGTVSMVTVEKANGMTTYCFAYTIAQTTHVETLAPAEA